MSSGTQEQFAPSVEVVCDYRALQNRSLHILLCQSILVTLDMSVAADVEFNRFSQNSIAQLRPVYAPNCAQQ